MSFVDRITQISTRIEPETAKADYDEIDTEFYELFRNERRQLVVKLIDDHDSMAVRDLAEHIAAFENSLKLNEVARRQYKTVYVQLYQNHLDKLDSRNFIDYDARSKHVTRTTCTEDVRALLERIASTEVVNDE